MSIYFSGATAPNRVVLAPVRNPSPTLRAAREMIAARQNNLVVLDGLGQVVPGGSSSEDYVRYYAVAGRSIAVNLTEIARGLADTAETILAFLDDPCAALATSVDSGLDYASEELQKLIDDYVNDALGQALDAAGSMGGGGVDIQAIKNCADRVKNGGSNSCTGMAATIGETIGKIAGAAASSDYVGIVYEIIRQIIDTVIAVLVGFLLDQLFKRLKAALLKALEAFGCKTDDGSTPDGGQLPGGGEGQLPPPPLPSNPPPVVQPPPTGGGGGGTPSPRPPPPMFVPKKTPWTTYAVWGGAGVGVALVASKVLAGAWVPSKVAKAAKPVTSRIKRLKP